mgnify:CR=1 FL=1
MALRLTEIFFSLQGEASRVGLPTVFVRLTGCPLRCSWCDTTYSFTGGKPATVDSILAAVARYPTRHVCVTGGEPLAQKECLSLLEALCDHPELDVDLVPVTVLWGREPDKEDNWFKLLLSDDWNTPGVFGQLVNIGVHGRHTFVQFHEPLSLRQLMYRGPAGGGKG